MFWRVLIGAEITKGVGEGDAVNATGHRRAGTGWRQIYDAKRSQAQHSSMGAGGGAAKHPGDDTREAKQRR